MSYVTNTERHAFSTAGGSEDDKITIITLNCATRDSKPNMLKDEIDFFIFFYFFIPTTLCWRYYYMMVK